MLIAEDLMLLLLDPAGRPRPDSTKLGLGLAGAVMLDLALLERVGVADAGERVKAGRVIVRDATPTNDPLLDEALRIFGEREGRKPQDVLPKVAKGLKGAVLDRLVAAGLVQHVEGRALGIFPTHSWPATHASGANPFLEGIRSVLVHGRTPTDREASLICLLQALDCVPAVVGDVGLPKRELRRRAKAVRPDDAAGVAVRKAIEAVQAASMAAITAATAVGAASS